MIDHAPDQEEYDKEQTGNSVINLPESAIFRYYREDNKETGGMKVKWTIRVAQGAEAARLDDRQNHAIRELPEWAARRQRGQDRR
jgi:hypothetical protein